MKRDRARSLHNQQGYNLIEAAIVLGVAGLVVAGVFAAWGAVSSQNKMRRAQDQITVIVNQIRSTYGNRNQLDNTTDGGAFTNALLGAGLLPDSWVVNTNTNTVGNPYGGDVVVAPDSMPSSSAKDAMVITFSKVNQPDCYKLAANMLGSGRAQGLYKIGSANVATNTVFADIKDTICTSAMNSLSFNFSLKTGNQ